jgi:hypothetical protein
MKRAVGEARIAADPSAGLKVSDSATYAWSGSQARVK